MGVKRSKLRKEGVRYKCPSLIKVRSECGSIDVAHPHSQVFVYDIDTLEELGASCGLRCSVRRNDHRVSIRHRVARLRCADLN